MGALWVILVTVENTNWKDYLLLYIMYILYILYIIISIIYYYIHPFGATALREPWPPQQLVSIQSTAVQDGDTWLTVTMALYTKLVETTNS
jgi:hypothetical protein